MLLINSLSLLFLKEKYSEKHDYRFPIKHKHTLLASAIEMEESTMLDVRQMQIAASFMIVPLHCPHELTVQTHDFSLFNLPIASDPSLEYLSAVWLFIEQWWFPQPHLCSTTSVDTKDKAATVPQFVPNISRLQSGCVPFVVRWWT